MVSHLKCPFCGSVLQRAERIFERETLLCVKPYCLGFDQVATVFRLVKGKPERDRSMEREYFRLVAREKRIEES